MSIVLGRARWFCSVLCFLVIAFSCCHVFAESSDFPAGFVRKVYEDEEGKHNYVVFVPQGYTSERAWPVVLFLHGASERGSDGVKPISAGLGTALELNPDQPFLAVFPQCESTRGRILTNWRADSPETARALRILDVVEHEYRIDPARRALCGWSMGGYGAWSVAAADPEKWAAVLAMSGGETETPLQLDKLAKSNVPVWAVHGKQDQLVSFEQTERLVSKLNSLGGNGTATIVDGVGHGVWQYLLADPRSLKWLANPSSVVPGEVTDLELQNPFPSMTPFYVENFTSLQRLPNMISLRMGNSALEVISQGIPDVIPEQALQGSMPDIHRVFSSGDEKIEVTLKDVGFECHVVGSRLHAISGGRFLSRFTMKPLKLKIGSTLLKAGETRAETGGFVIEIGHREPVSLDIEIQPTIGPDGLELVPLRQQFQIADKNWHIVPPKKVSINTDRFSDANVVTGVVGGLYLQKLQVEKTVLQVVPSLLKVVEAELRTRDAPRLARMLWPLPVLVPEMTISPSQVRTDQQGISLVFDMYVRASKTAPNAEHTSPHQLGKSRFDVTKLARSRDLDFRVSLNAIDALGNLAIREGYAYINVMDLPDDYLKHLAKRDVLSGIFPKSFQGDADVGDVGLRLLQPFKIHPVDQSSVQQGTMIEVEFPGVAFEVFHKETGQSLVVPFAMRQRVQIETISMSGVTDSLNVSWLPNPVMTVLDVAGNVEVDQARFEAEFCKAWSEWSQSRAGGKRAIPQLRFGDAALVLESFVIRDEEAELKLGPSNQTQSTPAGVSE